MTTLHPLTPRLLAGFGTLALAGAIGLVSSHPAHTAGGPITVSIANTPLATTDTTLSGRTPFSKRLDLNFVSGSASGTVVVPAGKRLVLTYVSTDVGVKVGASVLLDLATVNGGAEVEAHLPAVPQGVILGEDSFAASDPVTVYADPGSTVTFAALDTDTAGSGGLIVGLYGYLENA